MTEQAARARAAAAELAGLSTAAKNHVLRRLADHLDLHADAVLQANARDLDVARSAGLGSAKLHRLTLTVASVQQMAAGLRQVAELPDPVGAITARRTVASGLQVRKVRCPIGVIMMIYEARPNVTIDAFALCFKAGNACLLKGGREARHSNEWLAAAVWQVLGEQGISPAALVLLTTSDREAIKSLLRLHQTIDLVIPRGGIELIRFVHQHSQIPTIQHFHGVCHIFIDASARLDSAIEICCSAKTSAPATCNAVEAVLVHQAIADRCVPKLVAEFSSRGVQVRGDPAVCALAAAATPAAADDWGREFLDLVVAMRVVPDSAAAIEHIHTYGSNHTDAIITEDPASAQRFTDQVQSSCTLVNASTRFNDGYQLGLGAEIGISTSKIHAYGPMGLEELTTQRYVVQGQGHCR